MRFALFSLILVSVPALADELATPPAPPATVASVTPPTWSLGAGLTFFAPTTQLIGVLGGTGGLSALATTTPVSPSVSIERLFSPQFALGLGLDASLESTSLTGIAATSPRGSVGVGVSPRFIVTNPDAPVSFTLYSTLFLGYASGGQAVVGAVGNALTSAVSGGVGGGIALELKLLERLSVRAQANLVRLTVSRSTIAVSSGGATSESVLNTVGVNVLPTPSLELRLYL
ncbi:MAG: hypothetical protein GQE15_22755 [Archangiaceae bacterium]|nr:hypothetical protein [Archangiaceae bacterium]